MTQILRFFFFCSFVFFGLNMFAQSNASKLENLSSKLQHIESRKLILATPTSVVKHKADNTEYPEKPKKKAKKQEEKGLKPPKSKQAIENERNNPK